MLTTFDRYLIARFAQVFAILFVASLGLFIVVDGFTNLDEFQQVTGDAGPLRLLFEMAAHYSYQSCFIFDLIGPTLGVFSAMAVLGLLLRFGELHPVLAAGVPTYRLALPLMGCLMAVNCVLAANQELVLPRIAHHLQGSYGAETEGQDVEPAHDPNDIFLSGRELFLSERKLVKAEFWLPSPTVVADYQAIRADTAYYVSATENHPAGWLLKDAGPAISELTLTDKGKSLVLAPIGSNDIFVVSDITFDQLYNRGTSFKLLATRDLLTRIQKPTTSLFATRAQVLHLHTRLTRPVLTLIGLFLIVPLIVRKERTSIVGNVAICLAVLGFVYGLSQAGQFLGDAGLLRPEVAVWFPLIIGGSICAWLTPLVRT